MQYPKLMCILVRKLALPRCASSVEKLKFCSLLILPPKEERGLVKDGEKLKREGKNFQKMEIQF